MKKFILLTILIISLTISIIAQNNNDYKKFLNNGRMAVLNDNYNLGIKCFDTALQLAPTNLIINKDRGYAKMQLKQYDKAIVDFTLIINQKPYAFDVYLQRGIAYYHLSMLDSAFNDITKVLMNSPYHREAKEYMSYIENGKQLIVKHNTAQLKIEQERIEKIRLEKTKEREKIIMSSKDPIMYWYSVFETW